MRPLSLLLLALSLVVAGPRGALSQDAPAAARGSGSIRGSVVATETGRPLAGASVAVRSVADTAVVAGGRTDAEGRFQVEGLAPGRYLVRVSQLGYATHSSAPVALAAGGAPAELGVIRLAVAAVALQGVEVRSTRDPVQAAVDRTIYSTREMPATSGGTATDVMRNVPELEVDMDGKVKLRGNAPTIHINGRPAPMRGEALDNFLKQLPADRVERVEVIPNPGAKYEAEGMAGIVNIVLKDNVDLGLSGSVSLGTSTRGETRGSSQLAYQRGALTLFGGGSLSFGRNRYSNHDLRENLLARPVTLVQQDGSGLSQGRFGNVDLSAEWKLGRRATLWSSVSSWRSDFDSDGTTAYTHMDAARAATERYNRVGLGDNGYLTTDFTFGFRHQVQPQRHEFSVELRRSLGGNESSSLSTKELLTLLGEPTELPAELTSNDYDEDNTNLSLQADYTRPLGKTGKLETGYKASRREIDNDRLMQIFPYAEAAPTARTPSAFDHREEFHAAYLTLGGQRGRFGLQAGVRAEIANTRFSLPLTGESFDNDYPSLFPNFNLSYDLGDGRQARLTYSKRIERPYPFFLDPSNPSTDPLNRRVGNPSLKPKYTHSLSMDLSWPGQLGTLRVSPYFRQTVDNWDQIKTVDAAGVSTITWENLASVQSYGTSVTASLKPAGRVSGFLGLNGYREVRDASNLLPDYSGSALLWSANGNATLKVTQTLNAQGMLYFMPARQLPQGRASSMLMTSFGARQQLWKNKASLNVSVMDPFNLYRYEFETRDRTHVQTGKSSYRYQQLSVGLTYNFGRMPQSNRRRGQEEAQPQSQEGQGIR